MFPTPLSNLTDSWRWNTSLQAFPGFDSGAVSKNGNLFAVGFSSTSVSGLSSFSTSSSETALSAQFSVFKLRGKTGEELWDYNQGTDSGINRAYAVGVDAQEDVIVGGSTTGTWDSMPIDADTNNGGPQQFAAFKLDGNNRNELWRYQRDPSEVKHDSSNEAGWATAGRITSLVVDSTGDALFVGHVWDNSGIDSNYTVGKINGTSGETSWQFQGGLNGSFEAFWACGLDSHDSLVAAGLAGAEAANNLSSSDYLVVKFDGEGEEVWRWDEDTQPGEALLAIAIDLNNDVYVAGGEGMVNVHEPNASAAIVVKLDGSSGAELWRYPDDDDSASFAAGSLFRGIDVDDSTGVVVAVGVASSSAEQTGSSAEQTGSDSTHSVAIILNATTGEYLGQGKGTELQDEIYFALFDSNGSLFLGGHSSEGTFNLAVTKLESETSGSSASSGEPTKGWFLIFGVTAAVTAVLLVCLTYALCRMRRTIYLSKTVEDFGPVFRLGSTNLGGLPPTAKTPCPVPSYQSSSTRSVSSFAGGLRRTAGNWSFNASFRNLKLVNGGDSSRGNVGSARVFVTPDSPEGYAPKSPPEQEAPRHPDDVEAPTKFVDVTTAADIDIVACPRFFVRPTPLARKIQPPHYNPYPSPAYSVSKGLGLGVDEVHDSEFVTAAQPESQPTLAKNDSAAGSADDVKDLPAGGVVPDARELKSPNRVMTKYCSPFEKRNGSSTHLFPGEYWSSPLNLEATLRSRNLLPYQSKHLAAPSPQRRSSSRLSPPVIQSGRTDSDSASIFGGDSESAPVGSPLVRENGRSCSGIVMPQVLHPSRGITRPAAAAGLEGRGRDRGEAATAAPRPPCLKRSFSSEDSARQEETRRENLHRVESWLTKPTVFPKEVQKGPSLQTQELEEVGEGEEQETPPRKREFGNDHVYRGYG